MLIIITIVTTTSLEKKKIMMGMKTYAKEVATVAKASA